MVPNPPTKSLPTRPSLASMQKQAKSLVREFRSGTAEAGKRIHAAHPRPSSFSGLRDAQLVLAREYGFENWSQLTTAIDDAIVAALETGERADRFLSLACVHYWKDGGPRDLLAAQRILRRHPDIAGHSIHTAAAAANVEATRRWIAKDASAVHHQAGPDNCPPLLYLAYSRIPDEHGTRDSLAVLRLLLEAGADPDARHIGGAEYCFTAITGAIGEGERGLLNQPPHPRAVEFVETLLGVGADPNDSQALYNSQFTPSDQWLSLLLDSGLHKDHVANWTTADNSVGTLDYLLGQAVDSDLVDRVDLLLRHGANPDTQNLYNQRTAWENAVIAGHLTVANLLVESGATRTELSAENRFRAALSSGDTATAAELATPQFLALPSLLLDQAKGRSLKAVRTLLDLGLKVDVQNAAGVTALHQAAWNGDLALIDFLLTRGARTNLRDTQFHCTAVSWALESGQAEAADRILDRSDDVFDLVGAARLSQLETLFSSSPDLATTLGHAGNSPLHALRVVNEQTASVIALLRRCGANTGLPNDAGLTPRQAAEANHRWELEDLLI